MIMHRLGLATLALFLSACSTTTHVLEEEVTTTLPSIQTTNTTDLAENPAVTPAKDTLHEKKIKNTINSGTKITERPTEELISIRELDQQNEQNRQHLLRERDQLSSQIQTNAQQLALDTGEPFSIGDLHFLDNQQGITEIQEDIQRLRSLEAAIQLEKTQLKKRIQKRKFSPNKADLIQVYLSEATVIQDNNAYKTMPLVGEWTRGENRIINVKDKELFNSDSSEKIAISFTEDYHLLINGQSVMKVDAKTSKKEAGFKINNADKSAIITGTIDYKLK